LRYYFAYQVQTAPFNCGGAIEGYKLSLPLAALVHSSLEADAVLFWNRSFAEGTGILSQTPDTVLWEQGKKAMNLKWGALIQEPQDIRELMIDLPEPRALSEANLEHLAKRLNVVDGLLYRKNFFNLTLAHKEGKV
jgi:hypothetical protein